MVMNLLHYVSNDNLERPLGNEMHDCPQWRHASSREWIQALAARWRHLGILMTPVRAHIPEPWSHRVPPHLNSCSSEDSTMGTYQETRNRTALGFHSFQDADQCCLCCYGQTKVLLPSVLYLRT